MTKLLQAYNEQLRHEHGWEVPLTCPKCNHEGRPRYDGWTPGSTMNFGNTPTIYANLFCSDCGFDLHEAAGAKLVEMYSDVSIPAKNRQLIWCFVLGMIGVIGLPMGVIWLGIWAGIWGHQAHASLAFLTIGILPTIYYFNYLVAALRHRCECGEPAYKFMGLLGRSSCYRCSNCTRLMKLRD